MNIVVLEGSPNRNGSFNLLASEFSRGRGMPGMVLGRGCGSPDMTRRSPYPEQAYRLGLKLC